MELKNSELEIHAKDVERAINIAVLELEMDRDDLDIDVLDNGDISSDSLARIVAKVPINEYDDEPRLVTINRVLTDLLHYMNVDANLCVQDQDADPTDNRSSIRINIAGDKLSALIGRRGETLASLEFLVKLIVSNKQNRWTNISLDIDGYKQRREHQLKRLAQRMAGQVQQFGRPIALEPMPANERRIVHITLERNPEVTTNSTGDGNQRRVNIQPSLLR
ncbi:MAG: hypothetical protein CL606_05415 [Anaerolineaceae bacterium]|nr:hypothetical protein [Anaerolineaceae bacterium]|tara:strand:- start:37475 stop:38137 length:663 start_codon:yes stop_codon:yes gene_type:complete